ncbi:MAG: sulfite exporter TauE/SafE family protein [Actinomycetota bacterium]
MPSISVIELCIAAGAIAIGGLVHGSVGIGFVLVSAPVVGLIEPRALPALFVLLGFPIEIWMVLRERAAVDVPGFVQMVGGRVIGTFAAFVVLVVISPHLLTVLIGSAIVIAALLSWRMTGFRSGTATRVVAGGVSGLMGTVAAVGGPALALAYQDREGPVLRATLAATFLATDLLSVAALVASDLLHWWHAQLFVVMLPALMLGVGLSGRVIGRVDTKVLRTGVLLVSAMGGSAVVLKALL